MTDTYHYALLVLCAATAMLAAVLSNRLTQRLKVPAPLLMLVGAAVISAIVPGVHSLSQVSIERVVTLGLVLILFDGGMHIGWSRFRAAAVPIGVVGVAGTFLTAAAAAALLHAVFALSWYVALLVATAVAPTDPAVVFSVLGGREIAGRSATILEGESGANDPVGIALMSSLIVAGALTGGSFIQVGIQFALQMLIGGAVGAVGAGVMLWFIRTVSLPSEALYPLRTLACAFMLYGAATLAHGSGFLAVFVAGIFIGDAGAPYKREIRRFHAALASCGEIVAFTVLGLSVNLHILTRADVLVPGLILGAGLTLVIRPLIIGLCLLPARLPANEAVFILFAGLKGAVPILLGELLRSAHLPDAERLFAIVVVVVVLSVLVQGGLVPAMVQLLQLPVRIVEPEPWALGVRLRQEPENVQRLQVKAGSEAEDRTIDEVAAAVGDIWVSIVLREGLLVAVQANTTLQANDDVVIMADPDLHPRLTNMFVTTTAATPL